MPLDNKELVEAVKRKRERDGLSIRALATSVGISFSSLARIERGEGAPDNNSQIRLLEWLGGDAQDAGLSFDDVAYVHFRAAKNAGSKTIQCLLTAASVLRQEAISDFIDTDASEDTNHYGQLASSLMLSKEEMEQMASDLRNDLDLPLEAPLDSLKLTIDGVSVYSPKALPNLPKKCLHYLLLSGCSEWSAMSIPLDSDGDLWAILLNDEHKLERQKVTILEEYWHIMLGHKLTKIAKIAGSFGRTYDSSDEHDAYYLAAASLLPREALVSAIQNQISVEKIAYQFQVSTQLVEYRIKRLGLWRLHRKLDIRLEGGSI